VETVQQADAVLLAFPPEETKTILSSPGMKEAAQGKVIISMLARIPRAEISRLLESPQDGGGISDTECVQIVRAMPSIGTAAHESATFIASVGGPAEDKAMDLTRWIFSSVGKVFYVSDEHFDTITGMCAFSNALITTSIQAIAQRTSAEGVPVEQALAVSAQCIRGSLALILSGTSPEQLQTSLSAPGSITGQAIQALQDSRLTAFLDPVLRAAIDRAREDATNSD
jgi:pyrroline-5-carboxylate reductase